MESRGTVPVPALFLENSAFCKPFQRSRGRDGPATNKVELIPVLEKAAVNGCTLVILAAGTLSGDDSRN